MAIRNINVVPSTVGGILSNSLQQEILNAINKGVPISQIISDIIELKSDRDRQLRGLYLRYLLEPASKLEWEDNRDADGVPIFARTLVDSTNINIKNHVPFDREISTKKAGYAAGNVEISYNDNEQLKEAYDEIIEENNLDTLFTNMMESCADRGTSYLLLFADLNTDVRMMQTNEWESVVLVNQATGEPEYAMRYYALIDITDEKLLDANIDKPINKYIVEWYDGINVTTYVGDINNFSREGVNGEESVRPHLFGSVDNPGVPLVEFPNNIDRIGNVEQTLSMQDAYDLLISDMSNEIAKSALSFLFIKMLGADVDEEFKKRLKEMRVIFGDSDQSDAKFLSRDIPIDAVKELGKVLKDNIYTFSFSVNPEISNISGNVTAFQVERQYQGIESDTAKTLKQWKKSLRYMDERIKQYLTNIKNIPDYNVDDITREFIRVIPKDELQALQQARSAGTMIANKILIEKSGLGIDAERNEKLLTEEMEETTEERTVVDVAN